MDYKELVVESGLDLVKRGLTVETWGNISARDPETGRIYLTPSAMSYFTITPEDIVVMDENGTVLEGTRKPTIEWSLHTGLYRERKDLNAIIHTHPLHSQVFGVLHMDIPVVIDEAAQVFGGPVKVTEYHLPGSEELAQAAIGAFGDKGCACILANHGAVCGGKDMKAAFKACTVLEMTAEIYYKALAVGKPYLIGDKETAFMKDFADNKYGQGK